MMKYCKKITALFTMILLSTALFAQDKDVSVADTMRSNGRIYVVVAVVLTILIGLILYIIRLDRKITKLERESN
ncbi:MAG TPA: CcmD family protein [Chitinophagaceae bacterium]|nr:CcmD family protein [Chitinophagaceae bacterium]